MGSVLFTAFIPYAHHFFLVFHLFIACFMAMKYGCDKRRLYLVAIAFAFAGSALLMVGTLTSFPAWLDLYQFNVVNYNDAMIYYMFRHFLMAVLFIVAAILYPMRKYPLSRLAHISIVSGASLFTACAVGLAGYIPATRPCYRLTWLIMKPGSLWSSGAIALISL